VSERIIRRSLKDRVKGGTDWERVKRITDEEIEADVASDPDAPPLVDRAWFETAILVLPEPKQAISLRVDPDVLAWFRDQGPGYQSRMNAVLRQYAQAHGASVAGRSARAPRRPRKTGAA
jgi:uncharacterized protein (DUF4415 family)